MQSKRRFRARAYSANGDGASSINLSAVETLPLGWKMWKEEQQCASINEPSIALQAQP